MYLGLTQDKANKFFCLYFKLFVFFFNGKEINLYWHCLNNFFSFVWTIYDVKVNLVL